MTRRSRRLAAVAGALLLPLALAACGDDAEEGSSSGGGALDTVTIEGDGGEEPKVTFDGKLEPNGIETDLVSEGDGDEIAEGDSVLAHVWVGNGFTEEKAFSTYDAGQPQLFTVGDNLSAPFKEALVGHKVGSRVAAVSTAEAAFGTQGNAQLGLGNDDGVLFVVDLIGEVAQEPSGTAQDPAAWAPEIVEEDGLVTGLDFAGTPKPGGKLQQSVLVAGDGEQVEKGQTIYVNYLGQVYDAKKPFDDSYSRGEPASFPIGVGQVVKGWDQALVGQRVGSRVVLAIPPKLGYGSQGNEQAGIKGTDTLYFVVDILAAV